jgi:hypothetical protein
MTRVPPTPKTKASASFGPLLSSKVNPAWTWAATQTRFQPSELVELLAEGLATVVDAEAPGKAEGRKGFGSELAKSLPNLTGQVNRSVAEVLKPQPISTTTHTCTHMLK